MTEDTVIDEENGVRAMIGIERLLELVPISHSTVARMERKGTFPAGRIVAGRKVWFTDDVVRWQENLSHGFMRRSRIVKASAA